MKGSVTYHLPFIHLPMNYEILYLLTSDCLNDILNYLNTLFGF